MDSPKEYETVAIEIYGVPVRVRVPAGDAATVYRAAQLVRERIEQLRKPTDPPERVVVRVALEIAYEAFTTYRGLEGYLRRLLHDVTEGLNSPSPDTTRSTPSSER